MAVGKVGSGCLSFAGETIALASAVYDPVDCGELGRGRVRA